MLNHDEFVTLSTSWVATELKRSLLSQAAAKAGAGVAAGSSATDVIKHVAGATYLSFAFALCDFVMQKQQQEAQKAYMEAFARSILQIVEQYVDATMQHEVQSRLNVELSAVRDEFVKFAMVCRSSPGDSKCIAVMEVLTAACRKLLMSIAAAADRWPAMAIDIYAMAFPLALTVHLDQIKFAAPEHQAIEVARYHSLIELAVSNINDMRTGLAISARGVVTTARYRVMDGKARYYVMAKDRGPVSRLLNQQTRPPSAALMTEFCTTLHHVVIERYLTMAQPRLHALEVNIGTLMAGSDSWARVYASITDALMIRTHAYEGKNAFNAKMAFHEQHMEEARREVEAVSSGEIWTRALPILGHGERVAATASLISLDQRYELRVQPDGNLVIYRAGRAVWSSGSHRKPFPPNVTLRMQRDDHLVMYSNETPVWATGVYRTPGTGAYAMLGVDGRLYVFDGKHKRLWSTPCLVK